MKIKNTYSPKSLVEDQLLENGNTQSESIHRLRAYRETLVQISKEITVPHLSYSGHGYTQKKSN